MNQDWILIDQVLKCRLLEDALTWFFGALWGSNIVGFLGKMFWRLSIPWRQISLISIKIIPLSYISGNPILHFYQGGRFHGIVIMPFWIAWMDTWVMPRKCNEDMDIRYCMTRKYTQILNITYPNYSWIK